MKDIFARTSVAGVGENCCGCGACEAMCSVEAIHMLLDKDGFFYPVVDEKKCVNCGQCLKVCQQY